MELTEAQWITEFRHCMYRRDEAEVHRFTALTQVVSSSEKCTLPVLKVLLESFTAEPDYEVLECAVSAMSCATDSLRQRAIIEALPRLWREAREGLLHDP